MKPGSHLVLLAAARFYTPLIVLLALSLLAVSAPGEGAGFAAGMLFAVALAAHLLVFGATSARAAFPPFVARVLLALGLIASVVGAGAPRLLAAPQLVEGGLFAVTAAGGSLLLAVLVARAPTLRDEDAE